MVLLKPFGDLVNRVPAGVAVYVEDAGLDAPGVEGAEVGPHFEFKCGLRSSEVGDRRFFLR